ncbi:MAG: hypothetical protein H6708_25930 [Kofleriaceae bacterium]|nr:hypothetical protein [Myxococcales bacterium]MCB9563849.1 hypothetical protein [Kofleriaceae bacterium]
MSSIDWIPCLDAGWVRRVTADGVILYRREGRAAGAVVIRRARRPVTRLRDLIAAARGRGGDSEVVAVRRLVTVEGEHGALVELARRRHDETGMLLLGVVYADDAMATVDAVSGRPDLHGAFREVVTHALAHFPLGLGSPRRRRYGYEPPAGWRGMPGLHGTSWLAPAHPLDPSAIRVFDARPAHHPGGGVIAKTLFEDPPDPLSIQESSSVPLVLSDGLSGVRDRVRGIAADGSERTIHIATLLDDRGHQYNLRLETDEITPGPALDAFDRLLATVRAVPGPHAEVRAAAPVFLHWAD